MSGFVPLLSCVDPVFQYLWIQYTPVQGKPHAHAPNLIYTIKYFNSDTENALVGLDSRFVFFENSL